MLFVSSVAHVVRCDDHRTETVSIKFPRAQNESPSEREHPAPVRSYAHLSLRLDPSSIHTGTLYSHDVPEIMSTDFFFFFPGINNDGKDVLRNQI